jgi:hypothetical protein
MRTYVKPTVETVGSLQELTQSTIHKSAGSGDVIIINGNSIPVPGGGVTSVS